MANIICQSCGHENDQTRVFCQNCGIRLEVPESGAASAAPVQAAPPKVDTRVGRIPKPAGKGGGIIVGLFSLIFTFIEIGLVAALTAAIIQAWRTPLDVPVKAPLNKAVADKFSQSVKADAESPFPRQTEIMPQSLNGYLASTVKLQSEGGAFSKYVSFERLCVKFGTGAYDVVLEEKAFGHSFYLDVRYQVIARKNGVNVTPVAAYIGRLPLHPLVAPYIARTFQPAWDAMGPDLATLESASQIIVTPEKAVLDFQGVKPQ